MAVVKVMGAPSRSLVALLDGLHVCRQTGAGEQLSGQADQVYKAPGSGRISVMAGYSLYGGRIGYNRG